MEKVSYSTWFRVLVLLTILGVIFGFYSLYLDKPRFFTEKIVVVNEYKIKTRKPGPYVYDKEVDLRLIVITQRRAQSLKKLLTSIESLELDGAEACVDIWIDMLADGNIHKETFNVANNFQWSKGATRVHLHDKNVGIIGNWIDTWRPYNAPAFSPTFDHNMHEYSLDYRKQRRLNGTLDAKDHELMHFSKQYREIAVILEDDMTVSAHAWRFLKMVHRKYGARKDFAGTTLYSNGVSAHNNHKLLVAPRNESVFYYTVLGTWGFSPSVHYWGLFQDWFHHKRKDQKKTNFQPRVPNTKADQWFGSFLAKARTHKGTQDSMWEMWFVYFADMLDLYTIYSNIEHVRKDVQSAMGVNREEVGLHYPTKGSDKNELLIRDWDNHWQTLLPDEPIKFGWNGEVVNVAERKS